MSGGNLSYHQSRENINTRSHCRFCAIEMDLNELVDLSIKDTMLKYNTILKFHNMHIDFTEHNMLPKYTCYLCHNQFLESYNFFLKVIKSQEKLMILYGDIKNHINILNEVPDVCKQENIIEENIKNEPEEICEKNSDPNTQDDENIEKKEDEAQHVVEGDIVIFVCESPGVQKYNKKILKEKPTKDSCNSDSDDTLQSECEVFTDDNINLNIPNTTIRRQYGITDNTIETCNNDLEDDDDNVSLESECEVYTNDSINLDHSSTIDTRKNILIETYNTKDLNDDQVSLLSECDIYADENINFNIPKIKPKRQYTNKKKLKDASYSDDLDNNKNNITLETECQSIASDNQNLVKSNSKYFEESCESDYVESISDDDSDSSFQLTYGGIPMFIDEDSKEKEVTTKTTVESQVNESDDDNIPLSVVYNDKSWATYPWSCVHCKVEIESIEEVRAHSRYTHNFCFGFCCVDCSNDFNMFNTFVEHVREHREYLRFFCQYCNKKFDDKEKCTEHSLSHWCGDEKICEFCGDIFPDEKALQTHKKLYKKRRNIRLKKSKLIFPEIIMYSKLKVFESNNLDVLETWETYTWSCLDCFKVLPDVQTLRIHVQEVHNKCFAMKCSDCLLVLNSYYMFVKHVHEHRPNLKNFCQYCNQYFDDLEKLATHIESHFTSSQKPCYGCGQTFANDEVRRKHIEDFNAPRNRGVVVPDEDVTCNICFKKFKNPSCLKYHKQTHHTKNKACSTFVCDVCGKVYQKPEMYKFHLLTHKEKSHICQICNKAFNTKSQLKAHAKRHLEDRPYVCDNCGKSFKNRTQIINHMRTHSDIKPFSCNICGKRFKYKTNCTVHFRQHTGMKPYSCTICDKIFTNGSNCHKHMKRKHGVSFYKSKITSLGKVDIGESGQAKNICMDKKGKEWLDKILLKKRQKKNFCQYCNQYFEDLDELATHIESHFTSAQKPCYGCGQTFANDELRRKHIEDFNAPRKKGVVVDEDVTCNICFNKFKNPSCLKYHKQTHHTKSKACSTFVCDVCGKVYQKPERYKLHLLSHKEKSHVCQICNKAFNTKYQLKSHAKGHLEDRPYICDNCGKSFRDRKQISTHMITHSDIKPFSCNVCGKKFKYKKTYTVHFRQHTGMKPYSCTICDKIFTDTSNCHKHMKRKHVVSYFKSKNTTLGKVDIGESGQAKNICK